METQPIDRSWGYAIEAVSNWLDDRGFPRTQVPALPTEIPREVAAEYAQTLRALCERVGKGSAFRSRTRMVLEELAEVFEAVANGDLEMFADAVIDLTWVAISLGVTQGLPMRELWAEIARANYDKEVGGVKPAGWRAPDLRDLLRKGFTCK